MAPIHQLFGALLCASFVLLAAGCGDKSVARGDAGVDDPCVTSKDCRVGLGCAAGTCVSVDEMDAVIGSDTSSDAATSTDTGMALDFDACATVNIEFMPTIPTILILVDQSGSMTTDFEGISRWEAVNNVLFDPTDGVASRFDGSVRFGLALYHSDNGFTGGECPLLATVDPAMDNAGAMQVLLDGEQPSGDTPTGEAILGTVSIFQQIADRSPRVLLLATDGEPDTCAVPNPQTGQDESVAAAQQALQERIRTYVLSVGSDVGEPHLQDMANAGIGLEVGGSDNAPFWKANDPNALAEAVLEIVAGARPCVFSVQGATIDPAQAHTGVVELNETPIIHGDANGWTMHESSPPCFASGQCVELLGEACYTVQHDPNPTLRAAFPCDAVVTP